MVLSDKETHLSMDRIENPERTLTYVCTTDIQQRSQEHTKNIKKMVLRSHGSHTQIKKKKRN